MTSKGLTFDRVVPIFTIVFVDVLGLTVIRPLLQLYAAAYGATPLQIGLVAAAFPLAQLIGVPVMGALSDRFGRKPLLLISQITTCISFLMLAAATSLEMIILSRVVDGLFGANLATAQAAMTDISDEQSRSRALGLTGAAFGLGFLFGPAISLFALEFSDSLAMPAFIAAAYSGLSILLTLFMFKETLPANKRNITKRGVLNLGTTALRMLRIPAVRLPLLLMFTQQLVFFAFESLLGLFVLSRLGLLGQGTALIFIYVGIILIYVQVRIIGRWSKRFGDARMATIAIGLLAVGLLLVALTPNQPHPLYFERRAAAELSQLAPSAVEVMVGNIGISLPDEARRGFGGILWFLAALIPLSIGAGLIRPALNSLLVKRVPDQESGAVLGVSASFVSLADALAPLLGGLLFQSLGASAPFTAGGVLLLGLFLISWKLGAQSRPSVAASTS